MKLSTALVQWQKVAGRSTLPWQHNPTPYRVWLSEVMLQQTQVVTVIPYFQRFLARFPTLDVLAAANEDDVLALWSGLGYYSRARYLLRSAKIMYCQGVPQTIEQWKALPGVGDSTAAAIMVFSQGQRYAILDGNVKRILARVFAIDEPVKRADELLWKKSNDLLPAKKNIRGYTQGLMDLGALVCLKSNPLCAQCPLTHHCLAFKTKRIAAFPVPSPKRIKKTKSLAMLLLLYNNCVLLHKRQSKGIWAGLWSLPEAPTEQDLLKNWSAYISESPTATIKSNTLLGAPLTLRHELTHFSLQLNIFTVRLDNATNRVGCRWFGKEQCQTIGIPAPIKRILKTHWETII